MKTAALWLLRAVDWAYEPTCSHSTAVRAERMSWLQTFGMHSASCGQRSFCKPGDTTVSTDNISQPWPILAFQNHSMKHCKSGDMIASWKRLCVVSVKHGLLSSVPFLSADLLTATAIMRPRG